MARFGNCHCGGYRFELLRAESTEAEGDEKQAVPCSCAACTKLGAQWQAVEVEDVRVIHDEGKMMEHRSPNMLHKFCSVCGTTLLGSHPEGQSPWRQQTLVNLRALQGFNPFALERDTSVSPAQAQTTWPSTGSCLCGKVDITLLEPLETMSMKEDNCSICTRNAWVGAYPSKAQVSLHGTEHTQDYRFGRRFMGHPFCQTCGVHVYMNVYGPPQHVLDRLPEERKALVRRNLDIAPVNIRVLDVHGSPSGLDISSLPVQRTDEGQDGYEIDVLR
ncbi:glutathione-dependent formaldehyde-activating gfa [Grosmannia clavigera kw1407]|uniref:Glutathione-dependent formaldehyde-activating gfa n=1 Tax=Grosmannia clavigera (strain kw1407 / UAMH 11150) TaxID=655863 RepID=F0XPJ4_GROCL|nr:glutathione-dependent formaldehyde-activating gfa [Grosmannia clavigera kw1407]EFX00282.1 glutathione-dependent formaldehyde-activating gfa [Grosmannia clavigera kw1407]